MATSVPGSQQRPIQKAPAGPVPALRSYRVELPLDLLDEEGDTLDWLIGFTFDTLDARHLDLRIVADAHAQHS
ncbi:MAG: hypothetical protein IPO81_08330 [Kouleothrix sp.]|nr:hypothetical protein [Kouleothrix sp.]